MVFYTRSSLERNIILIFLFLLYGGHRDLHVLAHSFPTRRSSDRQGGEFGSCLAADFLDPLALVAKDNRALVVAGDQDLLVDFGAAVLAVRGFLGLDGG